MQSSFFQNSFLQKFLELLIKNKLSHNDKEQALFLTILIPFSILMLDKEFSRSVQFFFIHNNIISREEKTSLAQRSLAETKSLPSGPARLRTTILVKTPALPLPDVQLQTSPVYEIEFYFIILTYVFVLQMNIWRF